MAAVNIIADDLTGACDTGLQFHNCGFRVLVLRDPKWLWEYSPMYDAISLDIDTRGGSREEAIRGAGEAASSLRSCRPSTLTYKKVDSTLRGHIGAEIDAIMDVFTPPCALVAPAYPREGRQTIDGIHLVRSIPLAQTDLSRDPRWPIPKSSLPSLVGSQSRRRIAHIAHKVTSRGLEALRTEVERVLKEGAEIVTFDVVSDQDLDLITQVGLSMSKLPLFVGSAGLAACLGARLRIDREVKPTISRGQPIKGGSIAIVGSLSKASDRQVERAVERGTRLIRLDEESGKGNLHLKMISDKILSDLFEGIDTLIWTKPGREGHIAPAPDNPFAQLIRKLILRLAPEPSLRGIVLTGGDTASIVLSALEADALEIVSEVQPAVPCCKIVTGRSRGLRVITKAGAFGDEDTLVRCLDFLRRVKI